MKLKEWFLSLIAKKTERIIAAVVVLIIAFLLGVSVLCVPFLKAVYIGVASALVILLYEAPKAPTPSWTEIATEAGNFLTRAVNQLQGKLPVFQSILCTSIPVEDGTKELSPRWYCKFDNVSGMTLISIALVYFSQKRLSGETLQECCAVLQGLLAEDVTNGLVQIPVSPTYIEGMPALHLLDIKHDGRYLVFSFVYVDSEKTARKVHEYGAPVINTDSDDQDF